MVSERGGDSPAGVEVETVTQIAHGASPAVHGLVPALTSFVGREPAIADVAALLRDYRLVTVTGPGGVGKTRMAAEVARRVGGRFADGVWLAELARVQDPALVPTAVAVALDIRQAPGAGLVESMVAVLSRGQLLLILDNCEHVLTAAAELCLRLLSFADDVRILATSREPLGVAGEARYRLAPLSLPGPDEPAEIAGSEAVRLFAERARQADQRFALSPESRSVVAQIVRRLDGIPLAIELAAARVEALGLAQLADRLDDRLLTGSNQLAPERHRSLAVTADWSYQLLGEHERAVFRRLAVFPGPFTLEAAQAVAGADAGLAVLRLVDCSLIAPPQAAGDGLSRYVMLETLRAYAAGSWCRRARSPAPMPRWPDMRWGSRSGRLLAWRPVPLSWPPRRGWTLMTRPCTRPWAGRWKTTRPPHCGWLWRWRRGGRCVAAMRLDVSCCRLPPGMSCREAASGVPRRFGSAASRPVPTRPPA